MIKRHVLTLLEMQEMVSVEGELYLSEYDCGNNTDKWYSSRIRIYKGVEADFFHEGDKILTINLNIPSIELYKAYVVYTQE